MKIKYAPLILLLAVLLLAVAVCPAVAEDDDRLVELVNKNNLLDKSDEPTTLVLLSSFMSSQSGVKMTATAASAMRKMVEAAAADGISDFYAISGYRSYSVQTSVYNNKIAYWKNQGYNTEKATELAGTSVAPPGSSEHQTGMALDIGTSVNGYALTEDFGDTPLGVWLDANCWKYGFILRYPQGKSDITGYIFEPWHFRYVGAPHAEYMSTNDLTLEEYYDLLRSVGSLEIVSRDGILYSVEYLTEQPEQLLPDQVLSTVSPQSGDLLLTTDRGRVSFPDLVGHWSEREVCALVCLGVISGYPDNTFRPNGNITRSELIALVSVVDQLLDREAAVNSEFNTEQFAALFADVSQESWFLPQLNVCYQRGLVDCLLDTDIEGRHSFFPSRPALRREVAQCLAPLCDDLQLDTAVDIILTDMTEQDEDVRTAVSTLVDCGVIVGRTDGRFYPEDSITRAEVSAMLYRIICCYEQAGYTIDGVK